MQSIVLLFNSMECSIMLCDGITGYHHHHQDTHTLIIMLLLIIKLNDNHNHEPE